jgi:hypothetical protein
VHEVRSATQLTLAPHEPREAPSGFGLRLSSGAFTTAARQSKAAGDCRSPRRYRAEASPERFLARMCGRPWRWRLGRTFLKPKCLRERRDVGHTSPRVTGKLNDLLPGPGNTHRFLTTAGKRFRPVLETGLSGPEAIGLSDCLPL